jgi:Phage tail sheath C-terminal domain
MALVSPGIQISINDQSQYVNSNVGSVPLVIMATAQNKTYNSSIAVGTTKANAGKLLSFSSQRDLVTQMGTPTFQISSAGTPVNGSEINEYGLLAAYSALGLSNQLYAIRADVDLAQLTGTSVRPLGAPANNSYWLDIGNTNWGLYSYNQTSSSFSAINPLLITSASQVTSLSISGYALSSIPAPKVSVGNVTNYALVFVNTDGTTVDTVRLFYKADTNSVSLNNTWVEVGSPNWQLSNAAITGSNANPTIPSSSTLTINTVTVTSSGTTTVSALAASINTAAIPGVSASVNSLGQLQLFVTSAAKSNGTTVDGKMIITDGTNTPLALCGITAATYYAPYFFYGSYSTEPSGGWSLRPTGSVWWKTTSVGSGLNLVLKQYNTASTSFVSLACPAYSSITNAIYGLDPTGGGINIATGQVFADYSATGSANSLRFQVNGSNSASSATGGTTSTFSAGNQFTIAASQPGSSTQVTKTITLSSTTATTFVSDILAANIPYVTASVTSAGTINITHTAGGIIVLTNVSPNTPLTAAGFSGSSGTGYYINSTGSVVITDFSNKTASVNFLTYQPYAKPATGTYWYYSNPADVDIMIADTTGWKGYRNVTADVRGYNLSSTDSNGVIISATTPTSNSQGNALAAGDLWLNSSDLVNYPNLSRWNGSNWVQINNSDHTSSNGIVFADARWDSSGTTDVISGLLPTVASLLSSNYIDQDAPDYRLYPRGTLLFNTRRSGYNVKKFVANYFNSTSFPNLPTVPGAASVLPTVTDAWVTASGLDVNGKMNAGSVAQRAIVVQAMQSAVNSNLDVLSSIYQFNLLCAPGYPELIPSLITLNDNRGDTGFIIGDLPMTLAPNSVDITNYVNNTSGTGLPSNASANPYLALYYPAGTTTDLAGNTVVVPASHAALRTFLYNDQVSHPWFAPAGTSRGLVSNLSDIGYIDATSGSFVHNSISQGLRDALFTLSINPITQLPNVGLVIFGQLTRSGTTTARNRINVARLENYLRTVFNTIANGYLFEPNDTVTRKSIAKQIENTLNNILGLRGLYDYLVICDTSNNTAATIANNQLYVDVAIEPMRDVEFIYIPIAIYNPGSIKALNATSS